MRSRFRKINVTPLAFLVITGIFFECMLFWWAGAPFTFCRFLSVIFGGATTGLFFAFFASLGKTDPVKRGLAIAFSSVYGVAVLTAYFVRSFFKVFMTLPSILLGAGGVVGEFAGETFRVIFGGFWRILLFALPILLYAFFTRSPRPRTAYHSRKPLIRPVHYACFFAVALAVTMVFTTAISPDRDKLLRDYDFDSAVGRFGLSTSMTADTLHAIIGVSGFDYDWSTVESTAESAPTEPQEKEYGENALDLDYGALAESASKTAIKTVHSYVASQTPSKQNEFTGLFKGKNLIFITAEAFSAEVIDPELTPALYRMATKGVQFTDYYQPAWGGSTSTGEYSNIVGLVPTNGVSSIRQTVGHDMAFTIGNRLSRLGYYTVAYHNNTYTYYGRDKTHPGLGYSAMIGMGNGMEQGVKKTWPESDKEMIEFTLDQYINKQPFHVYYMSVSGHCNYSRGGNYMSAKNYEAVQHLDKTETVKCYLAANMELEYAMESLLARLEEAGIANDTVVVIGTDHYPYGLDSDNQLEQLYGYKASTCFARDHSRLILWSGCIEDKNLVVDTPTYSLDILPTLCNLFGVEYDSRLLVGRDVFSDQMPLVLWGNGSFKTEKGTYAGGKFTPAEGVTVEDGYAQTVRGIVQNKIRFSKLVLENDYYRVIDDLMKQKAAASSTPTDSVTP